MAKKKKTVAIDEDLLKWVESETEKKEFASLSHAVQKGLSEMKGRYEIKEKKGN